MRALLQKFYKSEGVGELYEDPYEFEFVTKKIIVTHKPQIVEPLAASGRYDVVIFGHTHKAVIEQYLSRTKDREKTWAINPGSVVVTSREGKPWLYLISSLTLRRSLHYSNNTVVANE